MPGHQEEAEPLSSFYSLDYRELARIRRDELESDTLLEVYVQDGGIYVDTGNGAQSIGRKIGDKSELDPPWQDILDP